MMSIKSVQPLEMLPFMLYAYEYFYNMNMKYEII